MWIQMITCDVYIDLEDNFTSFPDYSNCCDIDKNNVIIC